MTPRFAIAVTVLASSAAAAAAEPARGNIAVLVGGTIPIRAPLAIKLELRNVSEVTGLLLGPELRFGTRATWIDARIGAGIGIASGSGDGGPLGATFVGTIGIGVGHSLGSATSIVADVGTSTSRSTTASARSRSMPSSPYGSG